MRSTPLKLLALAAALSLAGAALGNSGGPDGRALAEVSGYRGWARVTPDPIPGNSILPGG